MGNKPRIQWLYPIIFVLLAGVLAVFWQTGSFDFVTYDDPLYVTQNIHVREGLTGKGLRWALTEMHDANWFPLTWLSHMLTVQLFGVHPGAHHLMNVFHHAVNAVLLLLVLFRMTGALWRSALVAALFAFHPLHVESVAWVAERKDVLSAFFCLLVFYSWCRYVESPGIGRYLVAAILFACGLMAKPMLVTVPFLLLLLDYWPLGRFRFSPSPASITLSTTRLLAEKLPLLLMASVSSIATLFVQQKGGGTLGFGASLWLNSHNAVVAYVRYLVKMIWPEDLGVLYPFDPLLPRWQVVGAVFLLGVLTVAAIRQRKRRPWLMVGWLWYLIMLVPVIGFVRIGFHSIADRYTYLPLIGLFVALAWWLGEVAERYSNWNAVVASSAAGVTILLAAVTSVQLRHWKNSESLYSHTLEVTQNNWVMHNNLASVYLDEVPPTRIVEAQKHLLDAIRLKPDYAIAYGNLGRSYQLQGENLLAVTVFQLALKYDPQLPFVHFNMGTLYAETGQQDKAWEAWRNLRQKDAKLAETLHGFINSRSRGVVSSPTGKGG